MTDLVHTIATLFAEVLDRDVQPGDDFFDLGGDSLAAEELLTRLSARLGTDLPGWLLLDHPSPEALADILSLRSS